MTVARFTGFITTHLGYIRKCTLIDHINNPSMNTTTTKAIILGTNNCCPGCMFHVNYVIVALQLIIQQY